MSEYRFLVRKEDGQATKFLCDDHADVVRLSRNPYPLTPERVKGLMKELVPAGPIMMPGYHGRLQPNIPKPLYLVSELGRGLSKGYVGFSIVHCVMNLSSMSLDTVESWDYFLKKFPGGKMIIKHTRGPK